MAEIKKRDNGWWARVTWRKKDGSRDAKSKGGFRTKRAAEAWARDYLDDVQSKMERGDTVTLSELFNMYCDRCQIMGRKPNTVRALIDGATSWNRALGAATPIDEIKPRDIQNAVFSMAEQGRNPTTIRAKLRQLTTVMNYAVGLELLDRSPVRNIDRPPVTAKRVNTYSAAELNLIERHLKDAQDQYLYPFILSAHYGLRAGEACGVRWCDLDFEGGILHVRGNLSTSWPDSYFGTPKTSASTADLVLMPQDIAVFESLRRQRDAMGLLTAASPEVPDPPVPYKELNRTDFVCWNRYDQILTPHAISKRFPDLLARLDLKKGSWHDLRRSYSTLLSEAGLEINTVSKAMRHSNVTITSDVYVAPTRQFFESATERMEMILNRDENL